MQRKRYLYKVYDDTGTTLITTWNDVVSEPTFTEAMNGGASEMTIKLARNISNFGENIDVKYNNRVKVYCFDLESGTSGVLIYSGFIAEYYPLVDGQEETVEVVLSSWWWQMNRYILEGDGTGIDVAISGNGYSNDILPTMTTNSAPSPYVTSASTEDTSCEAYKAFDNNLTNKWRSTAVVSWLKIYLGTTAIKVEKFTLVGCVSGEEDMAPKDFIFEGSNDDATWTEIAEFTNEQDWIAGQKRVYEVENDVAYKYYRISVDANNGHASKSEIVEVELMTGLNFSRVGATSIKYLSSDPSAILEDVLDKFNADDGVITYSAPSIEDTGTTVSYQFNTNTLQEVVKKIVELAPVGWYFRIGADDLLYFKEREPEPQHRFVIGRNISYYKQEKRLANIVNRIYFKGKGFLKKYQNLTSEGEYGRFSEKYVDERVTKVATANTIADNILDKFSSPEIRITLKVIDSNGIDGNKGYDIESVQVGDTCRIFNATQKGYNLWDNVTWDEDAWDYDIINEAGIILQIQKKEYHPDYVLLEISNRQPDIAKRIEDINRNLIDSQNSNNQVIPQT